MGYKPIGGVRRVSLHTADTVGVESQGVMVELIDDRSCYVQQLKADDGVVVVEHTLTLVARQDEAGPWLEREFVERAVLEGFVAKIALNNGMSKVVGHSNELFFEQPLRLLSLTIDSARSVAEAPTVTLTLHSEDTTIN